jgi:hypothetical protein
MSGGKFCLEESRKMDLHSLPWRRGVHRALLRGVADAYANRNPAAPELVEVHVVICRYGVRDSRLGRWRASCRWSGFARHGYNSYECYERSFSWKSRLRIATQGPTRSRSR